MPAPQLILERGLPLGILVLALVSVPAMMLNSSGMPRLRNLEQERTEVDEEISRLGQQIRELRSDVKHIKGDLHAVERVARDELGLVRKTELVFQFDE